jgi:hypothetical protein
LKSENSIKSIDNLSIEKEADKSIDKKTIENKSNEQNLNYSIEKNTIDKIAKDNPNVSEIKSGILSTSIRIVKEELVKAMGSQSSAEVKIGDIAPLTGLTRRTVDRVCRHLEKTGEFSFERLHRGMKVTKMR